MTVFYKTIQSGRKPFRILGIPGEYRIKVKLNYGESDVFSNEIKCKIAAAKNAAGVAAAAYVKENDLDRFFADEPSNEIDPKVMEKIDYLLKAFPGSTYEKYLYVGLGSSYFAASLPGGDRRDFDMEGLRNAAYWCGRAAKMEGHPFLVEAAYYAGKSCYLLKDLKNAKAYLTFVMESGFAPLAERVKATLRKIEMAEELELKK